MAEAIAPAPIWCDSVALELGHPSLVWMRTDIPTVVEIAHWQPGDSVLVLNCSTGDLAIQALKTIGPGQGRRCFVKA